MDNSDIQKLVEIAKMYYLQGMTQDKIAKVFDISRSAVSMSLTEAKSNGIVQVQIKDPSENNMELAQRLEKEFGLRKCIVVPSGSHNHEVLLRIVASQAARFASGLFTSHSSLGIAWGNSCSEFMRSFPEDTDLCDITVVPMVGTSPLLTQEYQLNESIRMFADKLRGLPLFIYSPGLVETSEDYRRIMESTYMKPILDRWQNLDHAVLGIGRLGGNDVAQSAYNRGQNLLESIRRYNDMAVGDICARWFNIRGEFIDCDHNSKLIGADAQIFQNIKHVMAIAIGNNKLFPIVGGLRTGVIHYFVTDENTARQVIDLMESNMLPE